MEPDHIDTRYKALLSSLSPPLHSIHHQILNPFCLKRIRKGVDGWEQRGKAVPGASRVLVPVRGVQTKCQQGWQGLGQVVFP